MSESSEATFGAPWGRQVTLASTFAVCLSGAVAVFMFTVVAGRASPVVGVFGGLVGLAPVIGALPFAIRGYIVFDDRIVVRRLIGSSILPRTHLQSVDVDPKAMSRSVQMFGNGGLFTVSGRFRNATLGPYRALVSDPERAVVLRYGGHTIVVSPDRPEEFARVVAADRHHTEVSR